MSADWCGIKSTDDSTVAKKWQLAAAAQCVPLDSCGDPCSQGSPSPELSCTTVSHPDSSAVRASYGLGTCRIPMTTMTTTMVRLIRRMSACLSRERNVGCRFIMVERNNSHAFCAGALIQINRGPTLVTIGISDPRPRGQFGKPRRGSYVSVRARRCRHCLRTEGDPSILASGRLRAASQNQAKGGITVTDAARDLLTVEVLEEWASRPRSTLGTAPDAIVVIDECGTMGSFGPTAQRLFGFHDPSRGRRRNCWTGRRRRPSLDLISGHCVGLRASGHFLIRSGADGQLHCDRSPWGSLLLMTS